MKSKERAHDMALGGVFALVAANSAYFAHYGQAWSAVAMMTISVSLALLLGMTYNR